VILYELTTGQRPFAGATLEALYRSILNDEPKDPRSLARGLSSDHVVVLGKALAKKPEDRYPTALALAQDLLRLRRRKPIHARRATMPRRLQRWIEREPKLAGALAAVLLCLVTGLVVTVELLAQARAALKTAHATTALSEAQLLSTRDPSAALELALTAADAAPRALVNDALLKILDHVQLIRAFDGGGGPVLHCDVSPKDDLALSSSESGGVRVFAAATGALVRRIERAPLGGVPALFGPDAEEVITGGEDGAVRRFALATGAEVANFDLDASRITGLALRPDGSELAVGYESGIAALCSLDGTARVRFDDLGAPVAEVCFSGDGAKLAIAVRTGRVLVLDVASGVVEWDFGRMISLAATEILGLALSADGTRAMAACADRSIWAWSLPPLEPPVEGAAPAASPRADPQGFGFTPHDSAVTCVALSADGGVIATGSSDRTVRLAPPDTFGFDLTERSAAAAIRALCFSHDSRFVLAASDDGQLRMLRSRRLPELARTAPMMIGTSGATCSPDGTMVASWAPEIGVQLWVAQSGKVVKLWNEYPTPYVAFAFHPGSRVAALPTRRGKIRLVDTSSGDEVERFYVPAGIPTPPIALTFDPTGALLLVTSGDGDAWLLDAHDGTPRATLRGLPSARATGTVRRAAFDAKGERVATVDRVDDRDVVRVWSTADGKELRTLRGSWKEVTALDVSSRGALVLACDDGIARVFELARESGPVLLEGHTGRLESALFDPAGARVATAGSDGAARLFDAATGRCTAVLNGHDGVVYSARLSPDGTRLLTAGWDGIAIVWDTSSGEPVATQQSHDRPILCAEFAPDGATVLSTGLDGFVRRWPADPLAFARTLAAESR
jgi:WD40 repeat protein